jgi:AcrR family transcriptional regulator
VSARRGVLREDCVTEALRIVEESGLQALSLREVARRLGVSHQSPYKHFPSRDHIVAEIARRAYDQFTSALEARPRSEDAGADFRAMGLAYIDYALANPLPYRLLFGGPLPPGEHHPEMMTSARRAFELLRAGLLRLMTAMGASAEEVDVDTEALFVWATVHGVASLLLTESMAKLDMSPLARERLREHGVNRIGSALGVSPAAFVFKQGRSE